MKYEEYRRKKWRERIKFDRRNQVDIEEKNPDDVARQFLIDQGLLK